jgi:hypothetical protein
MSTSRPVPNKTDEFQIRSAHVSVQARAKKSRLVRRRLKHRNWKLIFSIYEIT